MKRIYVLILLLTAAHSFGQTKNFLDRPYLETTAEADTLVVPDRIYLSIILSESDTKDRVSVEEMERRLQKTLNGLGIDTGKQLFLADLSTNYKDYFLRKTGVEKSKAFSLVVYDALMAGKVIQALESEKIANVNFRKVEISNIEELKLLLRSRAVEKGLLQAEALMSPLNKSGGKVLHISDLSTGIIYGRQNRMATREMAVSSADQYDPIEVDFKQVRLSSTVNLKISLD